MKRDLKANIWKLYINSALRMFLVFMPILVLFYQDNGLSMSQVLILQAVFSVMVLAFEIPSGYFSDIVGRKKSLIIGSLLGTVGYIVYSLSGSFYEFLIAEIILGFGISFVSGADSAMLYDTLLELKDQDKFKKSQGRMMSAANFSEGFAGIIGGFLAVVGLRLPFFIMSAVFLSSALISFTLVEPKRHKADNSQGNIKKILKTVRYALHEHLEVKWLIIYSAVASAAIFNMVWFIQPYFEMVGLPLVWFGLTWAVLQFSVGGFSLLADDIEKKWGRKKTLVSLIFWASSGYFLLSLFDAIWAILFIFLFYFARGINTPVIGDYVNKLIPSDIRATVLSVKSMLMRLIFVIVGPIMGWVSDLYSLQTALLVSGLIFGFFGLVSLYFLHKHKLL